MNYLDPINKLLIFIGWWVNYTPFFKGNLEKTNEERRNVKILFYDFRVFEKERGYVI